jgi:glutaredoxin-like protein NrdH
LLKKCDVRFEFIDLDLLDVEGRKDMIQELKRHNPALSFPTLLIEEKVIVGYREKEILETVGLTEVPKTKFLETILSKIKRHL